MSSQISRISKSSKQSSSDETPKYGDMIMYTESQLRDKYEVKAKAKQLQSKHVKQALEKSKEALPGSVETVKRPAIALQDAFTNVALAIGATHGIHISAQCSPVFGATGHIVDWKEAEPMHWIFSLPYIPDNFAATVAASSWYMDFNRNESHPYHFVILRSNQGSLSCTFLFQAPTKYMNFLKDFFPEGKMFFQTIAPLQKTSGGYHIPAFDNMLISQPTEEDYVYNLGIHFFGIYYNGLINSAIQYTGLVTFPVRNNAVRNKLPKIDIAGTTLIDLYMGKVATSLVPTVMITVPAEVIAAIVQRNHSGKVTLTTKYNSKVEKASDLVTVNDPESKTVISVTDVVGNSARASGVDTGVKKANTNISDVQINLDDEIDLNFIPIDDEMDELPSSQETKALVEKALELFGSYEKTPSHEPLESSELNENGKRLRDEEPATPFNQVEVTPAETPSGQPGLKKAKKAAPKVCKNCKLRDDAGKEIQESVAYTCVTPDCSRYQPQ